MKKTNAWTALVAVIGLMVSLFSANAEEKVGENPNAVKAGYTYLVGGEAKFADTQVVPSKEYVTSIEEGGTHSSGGSGFTVTYEWKLFRSANDRFRFGALAGVNWNHVGFAGSERETVTMSLPDSPKEPKGRTRPSRPPFNGKPQTPPPAPHMQPNGAPNPGGSSLVEQTGSGEETVLTDTQITTYKRELGVDLIFGRFGLYGDYEVPKVKGLTVGVEVGIAVGIAMSEFSQNSQLRYSPSSYSSSSDVNGLVGGFAGVRLGYQITPHMNIGASVDYLNLGSGEHREGGRKVAGYDFSKSLIFSVGLGVNF
jgi:hypothetical protein